MKKILLAVMVTLFAFAGNATEQAGPMSETERSIRAEFPFSPPEVGAMVSFATKGEVISGKLVKVSEKGVTVDNVDGWSTLYHKSEMPLESRCMFYQTDYEDFIKSKLRAKEIMAQRYAELKAEREAEAKAQAIKEEAEAKERAERQKKELLSPWMKHLYGYTVMQIHKPGILAQNEDGTVIYVTGIPADGVVDGDKLYNHSMTVSEPYSPPAKSNRLASRGGMSQQGNTQYRQREVKALRVWEIGTFAYRTTAGGMSTVRRYTADIKEAESYHK